MEAIKKFVVIGPESTGKSTLSAYLAKYFKTQWVPEFAREFLLQLGRSYNYQDLLEIAKGQLAMEEQYKDIVSQKSEKLLIVDTDMYVMKVWCEFVFNDCHNFILNQISERYYSGYLLCNTDLPWVGDELREYPDLETREVLFHYYRDLLSHQTTPWTVINGTYEERENHAVDFIKSLV